MSDVALPRKTLSVRRTAELNTELAWLRELYDRQGGRGPRQRISEGAVIKHAVHELYEREQGAQPTGSIGQSAADLEGPAL